MTRERGPGTGTPLVGRAAELDDLDGLVASTAGGTGAAVLLEGEAGVGKSALVDAVRSSARLLGLTVLSAAPSVDDGGPDHGPRVVVVEDLHAADAETLVALDALARLGVTPGTLVVATMRPGARSQALADVVTAWTRAGARHLELRPLTGEAALALAEQLLAQPLGPQLRGWVAGTGGNPRLVHDLVDALDRPGLLHAVDDALEPVDARWVPALDHVVRGRVAYLGGDVLDLLATASVLGVSFVVVDLASLAGCSVADCWRLLRHALAAGVVHAHGDRLAFRHDLVRGALYSGLDATDRRALHAGAARALEAAGAPGSVVAGHRARSG
jgi:predicted ATPase